MEVLVAAIHLHLQELVDYLQQYLIENESKRVEQYFGLTYQTSFQYNFLSDLQQFCTKFLAKFPEKYPNHLILLHFLKKLWFHLLNEMIYKWMGWSWSLGICIKMGCRKQFYAHFGSFNLVRWWFQDDGKYFTLGNARQPVVGKPVAHDFHDPPIDKPMTRHGPIKI